MSYHKPPNLPWLPSAVAQHLRHFGVDAINVGDCVKINVTVPADRSWIGAIVSRLLTGMTGAFTIEIHHHPDNFIRNVVVKRHMMVPYDTCCEEIQAVLNSQGCVCLTDEVERAIARKYCRDVNAIEAIEAEILLHQKEKEELVYSDEFDAAARARDLEYAARNRLESLVMASAKPSS